MCIVIHKLAEQYKILPLSIILTTKPGFTFFDQGHITFVHRFFFYFSQNVQGRRLLW